ncbi:MAG: hypothetical protein QM305_02455 [Bacteroidota bacterium]|nr:hypothetical protein [Bacteroidota bacterium]
MILKNKKGFTPIAVVEIDEWEAIRKYCDSRDVMCGGDYDCPYGGAINIWMQKDWIDPAGELHGSFYPDFSESSIGKINVYFYTGGYLNENQERPWETDDVEYSLEGNWSPAMGREHFMKIYRAAVGQDYFYSIGELLSSRS